MDGLDGVSARAGRASECGQAKPAGSGPNKKAEGLLMLGEQARREVKAG